MGVLHLILCQLYENNVRSSGGGGGGVVYVLMNLLEVKMRCNKGWKAGVILMKDSK
jgi:hypothetical protein